MSLGFIFTLAVGLSMDAFAVAICKGLAMGKTDLKKCFIVGVWFGGFQMLMPPAGYFLGISFADSIKAFDHWIAFVLLCFIGGKMIVEAFGQEEAGDSSLSFKNMLVLAVATSIDALAVGVSFAFLGTDIAKPAVIIGLTTLLLSMLGVKIGSAFGTKYKSRAEIAGGVILILLGFKILFEHLGVF